MPDFRYGHAAASNWKEAAEACLTQMGRGPASLGFLYVTDPFADHLGDIPALFNNRTGIPHWVRTARIGVCATGRE